MSTPCLGCREWLIGIFRRFLPDFPGGHARRVTLLECLTILERVHRLPETVVAIGHQLILPKQSPERLGHQLLTRADVVEYLPLEDEESAVDAQVRFC